MKKIFLFVMLAVTVLFSCSKENSSIPNLDTKKVTIVAKLPETSTKTALNEAGKVVWKKEESIKVFNNSNSARFTSTNTDQALTADFVGEISIAEGTMVYGLYPYSDDASCTSEGVITTTLPAQQKAVEGETFADELFITMGQSSSEDLTMTFYDVCSGIRFKLTRTDVEKVILKAVGGEPIAGKFTVGFGTDGKPEIKKVTEGSSSIVLFAPDGGTFKADTWYYFVTLPATLSSGVTFSMCTEYTTGVRTRTSALTLQRAQFKQAANLDKNVKMESSPLVYYGGTNSILLKPGETAGTLDVTPYLSNERFEDTKDAAPIGTPVATSAKLLWKEGITAVTASVSNNTLSISGVTGYGNAVVGIYDSENNLLWSYHVWHPEDDPTTATLSYTQTNSGTYTVMPMYLGATKIVSANDSDEAKAAGAGLYYQWGRKDPLGRAANITDETAALASMTDENGAAVDLKSSEYIVLLDTAALEYKKTTHGNLDMFMIRYTIKNPKTFIQVADRTYNSTWTGMTNNYLWGNPTGYNNPAMSSVKKSIFDPSPAGYRVAPRDLWLNFTTTKENSYELNKASWNVVGNENGTGQNVEPIATHHGYSFYYQGRLTGASDFYLAPGYRVMTTGNTKNVGIGGYIWASSPYSQYNEWSSISWNAANLCFDHEFLLPLNNSLRAHGFNVLCVKE